MPSLEEVENLLLLAAKELIAEGEAITAATVLSGAVAAKAAKVAAAVPINRPRPTHMAK